MRLTDQTRYALSVLVCCAEAHPKLLQVGALADQLALTEHTIYKLLKIATKGGLIVSTRGRGGGIRLAKEPASVSVGLVVRTFEPRFRRCDPAALLANRTAAVTTSRVEMALGKGIQASLSAYDATSLADIIAMSDAGQHLANRAAPPT